MIATVLTGLILLGLAINHFFYGTGCWGFQPGGDTSSLLFALQAVVSITMLFWGCYWLFKGDDKSRFLVIGVAFFTAGLAAYCYLTTGWRMHTSIHFQGTENLPTFLFTSGTALILGIYKIKANKLI